MNSAVGAYDSAVEALALGLSRTSWAHNVGAEYDDLFQEGRIFVWLTLEKGKRPSTEHIENAMKMWIRKMGRQKYPTGDHVIPYDDELSVEG